MKTRRIQPEISFRNAVHLRSAELWLQLGQPMQALSELRQVPLRIRKHPRAKGVCRSVYEAVLT